MLLHTNTGMSIYINIHMYVYISSTLVSKGWELGHCIFIRIWTVSLKISTDTCSLYHLFSGCSCSRYFNFSQNLLSLLYLYSVFQSDLKSIEIALRWVRLWAVILGALVNDKRNIGRKVTDCNSGMFECSKRVIYVNLWIIAGNVDKMYPEMW